MKVEVDADELNSLLREHAWQAKRIDELLTSNTLAQMKLRELDRTLMVREGFVIFEQPRPERVAVPDDKTVRFRVRLVVEEVLEFIEACFSFDAGEHGPSFRNDFVIARNALGFIVDQARVRVNLPEAIDACVDIGYTVEGFPIACGVDIRPMWKAVQRSNLAKAGASRRADGKHEKPPGWTPPDIEGALANQGWVAK